MKKPLWQPTEHKKNNSLIEDFSKFINFKSNKNFKSLVMEHKKSRKILV